jgi:N-acetylmuramoyl-L-alanine amidase
MKRNIRYIVVHCTSTPPETTLKPMLEIWRQGKENPPYHYLIDRNGMVIQSLFENSIAHNDTPNNEECMHIAYLGGINKAGNSADTRSKGQKDALYDKLVALSNKYHNAVIVGKNELCETVSPCFNVKQWIGEYEPDLSEEEFSDDIEFLEAA